MRRKLVWFLSLIVLSMTLLTGCSSDTTSDPKFYHEYSFLPVRYEQADESWKSEAVIEKPSNEQIKIFEEVFQNLREVYQQDLVGPKVAVAEFGMHGSYQPKGCYIHQDDTIYLEKSFSKEDVPVLAHEIMHYFSYNAHANGMAYLTEDKSLIFGTALEEGIANYFSTRVYPFSEGMSVYEYETHVAEMLAILMGEDELKDAFFSSGIRKIREVIISKQEFDCFDVLVVSLDSYNTYLSAVGQIEGAEQRVFDMAESIEETLMKALDEAGKLEEGQKALAQLIEKQEYIDWQGTNLPQLLK